MVTLWVPYNSEILARPGEVINQPLEQLSFLGFAENEQTRSKKVVISSVK